MKDFATTEQLRQYVTEYRKGLITLCYEKKGIHIGGVLSCAEILVTLFMHTLRLDPNDPRWDGRDRFILSKGHSGAGLYYVMGQRGFFPLEELMETFKGYESRFGTHPCRNSLSCLEISSGSLGHGLSIAAGMALAAKLDGKRHRVFCLTGDAELQEGSNWEAAMAAAQYGLGNLILLVDKNGFSMDGRNEDIMGIEPLADKWRAFNWNVLEIDGNDLEQVVDCFDSLPEEADRPTVVLCATVKGKGVSYMENNALFHSSSINEEQYRTAIAELERSDGHEA